MILILSTPTNPDLMQSLPPMYLLLYPTNATNGGKDKSNQIRELKNKQNETM